MPIVVETSPFCRTPFGTRSHRVEHAAATRDLRIDLGRTPTAAEYAAVRQHVATQRRAAQQRPCRPSRTVMDA
jgi:hypothetical protein